MLSGILIFTSEFELSDSSILGKIQNKGIKYNTDYFADFYQSEKEGIVLSVDIIAR